jgi:hypothetical protein
MFLPAFRLCQTKTGSPAELSLYFFDVFIEGSSVPLQKCLISCEKRQMKMSWSKKFLLECKYFIILTLLTNPLTFSLWQQVIFGQEIVFLLNWHTLKIN